jgi:hypothetical protein
MNFIILFFFSICACSSFQQLGGLEHLFNEIRMQLDFSSPECLYPEILDLNRQVGDMLEEDYGKTMSLLFNHHNIDFIGIFFWKFTEELDKEDLKCVFMNLNEKNPQGKFKYYKLTWHVVSDSIDKIKNGKVVEDRELIIFHLKNILNRFAEEAYQIQEGTFSHKPQNN